MKDKVNVVLNCTVDQRAFIKTMAANRQMTISEFLLYVSEQEAKKKAKVPNAVTLESHKQALNDEATSYLDVDDLLADMKNW